MLVYFINFINYFCTETYEIFKFYFNTMFSTGKLKFFFCNSLNSSNNIIDSKNDIIFSSFQFNYILLLLFFCCALFFSFLLFFINYIFVKKNKYYDKSLPYECGFDVTGSPRISFNVQFYIIAILFLIFDVELVITYPWLVSLKFITFGGNLIICFFFLILLLSYFYESFNNCFNFKNFF